MSISDPNFEREKAKYDNPIASRELILAIVRKNDTPMAFKAICASLRYSSVEQKTALKRRLRAMEKDGQLTFNKFKQYEIAKENAVITGQVIGHKDGFGFLTPDDGGKDYFISQFEMQKLFHGDKVKARLSPFTDKKGRQEVQILEVVSSEKSRVVGRFFVENAMAVVIPDDTRICQDIVIPPSKKQGARHGQMVIAEITQRPDRNKHAVGQIVEVLGEHMAPGMEIQIALNNHDIPHVWPKSVQKAAAKLPEEVPEDAKTGRVDLRELPLFTIDGEDARDFDDAVFCQQKPSGGWRLWVAIADVSYYVRPNTPLDTEAVARGNSVYFPGQVVPMLPEALSNGLCSLNPDVDRLCMTCEMTVSAKGKLSGYKFYPAVMRSHARMTYTKVAAILDGDVELREQYKSLLPYIEDLHAMYQQLNHARHNRGAIAFETQESRFIFDAQRKIESIVEIERNDAHKIIEECMILANVATAKFVLKHNKEGVYRVHDKPSEEKYGNFIKYLAELGVTVPFREEPEPADYGMILEKVANRPDQELIQTMLLRSMKQATYDADNIGHFGLSLDAYSHFTSPIRRYPDLIIHRVIKSILAQLNQDDVYHGALQYDYDKLQELGEHCSMTERRADEATRDVADWLKCEYMQDHVGDEFEGVVSSVTNFGLFVRLADLHIEGLVHISSLPTDYYIHDSVRLRLIGENTGKVYHVGDQLKVQVVSVNLEDKKIDLIIAGLPIGRQVVKKTKKDSRKSTKHIKDEVKSASRKKPSKSAKKKETNKHSKKKSKKKSRPGKNARKRSKT